MIYRSRIVIKHALRDMRGSLRHFRLLFTCLCLGVTAMTCIGLTIHNIKSSVERDAKALLGGDVEIRQIFKELPFDVTSYILFNDATLSRSIDMRAMASPVKKGATRHTLVEIKSTDQQYPLYGELKLSHTKHKNIFFSNWKSKTHGAAVDQSLLDRLDIELGDKFVIGDSKFRATALIEHEPDRSIASFSLGPRVLVNMAAIKSTGLIKNTSLVHYRYRIKLADGVDATQWKAKIKKHFAGSHWNIQTWDDKSMSISRQIDKMSLFFVLTAMTTLIVAGIGISNATGAYLWGKRRNIAIMKCVGASQNHIHSVYLLQLTIIAVIAIMYGLMFGVFANMAVLHFLKDVLSITSDRILHIEPMFLAAAMGFITLILFSLLPLQQAQHIRPTSLLRGYVEPIRRRWRLSLSGIFICFIYIILIGSIVWLSILFTHRVTIPLYFAIGLCASFMVLYLLSVTIKIIARFVSHQKGNSFITRMALGNLARPGAATTSVIIALGIGMSVLTAISLVSSNMRDQLDRSLPERAPALFLMDVQPSDLETLTTKIKKTDKVEALETMPIVRGNIIKLNGVLAENAKVEDRVKWAINGTRGLTYAASPPKNSVITKGVWWPKDYKGKPLVSFDANLARGMHLDIGDTITIAAIGKEVTATIANLRDIPWGSLEMNFTTIFSPGSLDNMPITHLATVSGPHQTEKAVAHMIAQDYPSISIVHVRQALGNVSNFIQRMSLAIYVTSTLTLLCGALVMASAIHATLFKRKLDTVMMKVIGMTRKQIMRIYLKEFLLIALVSALIATVIGSVSAYSIMQLLIFSHFELMPNVILTTLASSIAIALLLGFTATRMALRVKPLSLLRND